VGGGKTLNIINNKKNDDVNESTQLPRHFQICSLLRHSARELGVRIKIAEHDKSVGAWVGGMVTDPQLNDALHQAAAQRKKDGDTSALNAGFIDCFVKKIISQTSQLNERWFESWSGIVKKAAELGVERQKDEPDYMFKQRVYAAGGVTAEVQKRAK
jgi:hypothetical protein